ncbi:hypothetical protein [Compostimonas suwonensis]|uniref:YtxH domain-containing protein n=1 Tax=Compostimonas suwonensis TaxID=1048394 RepID=A0A2M9BVY9_9MICO|nr:hypothetical protein [Compostimonas suwonensis]PJJ62123.1 hypothetical protein CLV54_1916 [Compostimonas suwonensis]
MFGKIVVFAAGLGVGYILGTRAGRAKYNQIKRRVDEVWNDPRVQKAADDAQEFVREAARDAGEFLREKAPVVQEKVGEVAAATKDAVSNAAKRATKD